MRKHLIRATAIGAGFALIFAASALAKPERSASGNLFLRDNGGISPSKLPQHKQVPISARSTLESAPSTAAIPPR